MTMIERLNAKEKKALLKVVERIARDATSPMLNLHTNALNEFIESLSISKVQQDALELLMQAWQFHGKREACLKGFCLGASFANGDRVEGVFE